MENTEKALLYHVGQIYDTEYARQDEFLTRHGGSKVPTLSKATLTVFAQVLQRHIQVMGFDLQAFALHAGRKTITVEDVLLLVRKDPAMVQKLQAYLAEKKAAARK